MTLEQSSLITEGLSHQQFRKVHKGRGCNVKQVPLGETGSGLWDNTWDMEATQDTFTLVCTTHNVASRRWAVLNKR